MNSVRSLDPVSLQDIEAISQKVSLYLDLHRYEAAEKLLRATIQSHERHAGLHNLLGLTFHKQSQFVDAIREFETALKINPDYVEAGLNLAATLCDLSRYDEARQIFEDINQRTHQKRKQSPLVLGRIASQHAESGKLYEASGMHAEAIQEYRKAAALFEPMVEVRMALARLYMRTGQMDRAKVELETLLNKDPEIADAQSMLGLLLYKLGRSDQAREHWHKAQKHHPNHASSRAYLRITATY